MAQTSMLHVRIDDALKTEATERLADFGLTVSDAVRILLTRIVKEGGLPAGLTADPQLHGRLGGDGAVGALLGDHAPGLELEQRRVVAALAAQ